MKLNNPEQSILGGPVSQSWAPRDVNYYERQWRTQRGAWGDSGAENRLEADVRDVIDAFKSKGTTAALVLAQSRGVLEGARTYLSARACHEEELAAMLARTRARLATSPQLVDKVRESFLKSRLAEVRAAFPHTPDQAVIDKPEVPRKMVPKWVFYASLALSTILFLRSLRASS